MSDFTSFFNSSQQFGLNIVSTKTSSDGKSALQQVGETATNVASGVLEPLFSYLEENENVFSGDISAELNKTRVANFNTNLILDATDEAVNGKKPSFDTKF